MQFSCEKSLFLLFNLLMYSLICFVAGKSSLVPQFLLEENMEPILCTQPRRFAVVAIARAIAESRNWQLGEEVGYHIGHSNVSDLNSKRYLIHSYSAFVLEIFDSPQVSHSHSHLSPNTQLVC
jgi:hypothetical protein